MTIKEVKICHFSRDLLGAGGGYVAALLLAPQKKRRYPEAIKNKRRNQIQAMDRLEKLWQKREVLKVLKVSKIEAR